MLTIHVCDADEWYCDGYDGEDRWVIYTDQVGGDRRLKAKKKTWEEAVAYAENLYAQLKKEKTGEVVRLEV